MLRGALDGLWNNLSSHYATGIEHINGQAVRHADPGRLGGAMFLDLNQALKDHPDLVRRSLMTEAVTPSDDIFAALHAAFWTGGTLLYVPRGVKVEAPLFSLVGMAHEGRVDFSHTLVVLEEDAEATLVRETASSARGETPGLARGGPRGLAGPGLPVPAGEHPELGLLDLALQPRAGPCGPRRGHSVDSRRPRLTAGEGQPGSCSYRTGGQRPGQRRDVHHGTPAPGLLHAAGPQAPHTTSDLLYKGGLKDRSRIVWKGMIRVEKDAQRTDAYQKNDNLVLSEASRGDSIPGLEIEANDVRCTHGATAGRVDEEMIFYSQARGIPRETAIRLIVEGFFANVYDRITLEPVQETLRQAVAEKLGSAE